MYKIGELSKLCNISVKTLRYYDAEGLLIPDEIDKFTGYRYYSASKLEDCYRIIALKELGFSLDEICVQLTTNDNEKITAALNAKLDELQALIKTTQTQLLRFLHRAVCPLRYLQARQAHARYRLSSFCEDNT